MADVKWIKIVVDIFDDEKIKLIEAMPDGDSIIVCWFKLLCLAGRQNNYGVLMLNDRIAYTDEMLATVFRRPLQTVRLALATFEEFGMIEIINGAITIPNWGKHQNIEGIDKVRDQTRERVARYRERQKLLIGSNVTGNATVTESNGTDIEEDKEEERRNNNVVIGQQRKFTPPTVEEVQAYCDDRKNGIDAQHFIDYYTANGWKVGRNSMKDWKAAVRTWERNHDKGKHTATATGSTAKEWNVQYTN